MFRTILAEKAAEAHLSLTERQLEQLTVYYEQLVERNKVVNLTAIVSPEDVAVKHMIDSFLAWREDYFPQGATLCDVGTGAGFPGLALKIYRPDLRVTLMDSLAKRLAFLNDMIALLGLTGVTTCHMRAEDAGRAPAHREKYDVVTARAVARLAVLAEYTLPLVKVGGYFVAMKGPKFEAEMNEAQGALKKLNGRVAAVVPAVLPGLDDGRAILYIEKMAPCAALYPRRAGLPEKSPLA